MMEVSCISDPSISFYFTNLSDTISYLEYVNKLTQLGDTDNLEFFDYVQIEMRDFCIQIE